jgi:hypothetical protein
VRLDKVKELGRGYFQVQAAALRPEPACSSTGS